MIGAAFNRSPLVCSLLSILNFLERRSATRKSYKNLVALNSSCEDIKLRLFLVFSIPQREREHLVELFEYRHRILRKELL